MKKIYSIIGLIVLILSPKWMTDNRNNNYYTQEGYLGEVYVMKPEEKISLDIDKYKSQYDFDNVIFHSNNESVARINYKEEILSFSLGKTNIFVDLFKGNERVIQIMIGTVIVIDINDEQFQPINSYSDLKDSIKQNPSGYYYLARDIVYDDNKYEEPIPYFEGVLINPFNKIIKGLNLISSESKIGLFQEIRNAYIDGLILRDIKVEGDLNSTLSIGSLVGSASNSYISNVSVTGELSTSVYIGGIVGSLNNSSIINSSFSGVLSKGQNVGGITGIISGEAPYIPYSSDNVYSRIINCSVNASINGGYEKPIIGSVYLGGISGIIYSGLIRSSYFTGELNYENDELVSPIGHGADYNIDYYKYFLVDVYYTIDMPKDNLYSSLCKNPIVHFITDEELRRGNTLKGLEDFTFIEGEYPFIER